MKQKGKNNWSPIPIRVYVMLPIIDVLGQIYTKKWYRFLFLPKFCWPQNEKESSKPA